MGLFDIFKKKKKTDSTFPENELEKSLMKASSDLSARENFYMKLLWNELFVLTNGNTISDKGVRTVEKGETVEFVTFPDGEIPIFSSTNRIFDKGIIKSEVPFMAMKGQDLFGVAKGATFILNPYSKYGKELLPNEIAALLDGSIFNQKNEITIEEDTEVRIGQPANYPTELVNALIEVFKSKQQVNAAYLAIIKMDASEKLPHLMIGIDVDEDMQSVVNEAGPIAEQILKGDIIDFIQIDKKAGGVSSYFLKETKPFYKR